MPYISVAGVYYTLPLCSGVRSLQSLHLLRANEGPNRAASIANPVLYSPSAQRLLLAMGKESVIADEQIACGVTRKSHPVFS